MTEIRLKTYVRYVLDDDENMRWLNLPKLGLSVIHIYYLFFWTALHMYIRWSLPRFAHLLFYSLIFLEMCWLPFKKRSVNVVHVHIKVWYCLHILSEISYTWYYCHFIIIKLFYLSIVNKHCILHLRTIVT